jgi:hypothetical protein
MTAFISTSYVSRVSALPPLVARAAFDDVVQQGAFSGAEWQLLFPERDLHAVLMCGWGLRAAVMVEIEPWSRSRVMVGIRHRSRNVPWWSERYFTSAHEAVRDLSVALQTWADAPLRALTEPRCLIRSA